jgi:hypothetical protein
VSLRHLWAFLAVALPVLAALIAPLPATGLTYHLRAGEEILTTGRIPAVDSWTFTVAGEPWLDQQWGGQVIITAVFRIGSWTGLVLFRAALVGLIAATIFELCRRQGTGVRTAAWLSLGAFAASAPALALRPQLIAMALFAVTLFLVVDRAAHPRRLWLVVPVVVLWANVHGSFFLAPALLGLAWIADIAERPSRGHLALAVAVVTAVACCLTPFGPSVWVYAAQLGANPAVTGLISEWQSTSLRDISGVLFYGSALLVAAYLARRGRPTSWPTLLWLGFFFVIGAYAARGIAWWPFAAVAALAPLIAADRVGIEEREPETPRGMRLTNAFVAATIVVACVALLPVWRPTDPELGVPQGVLSQAPPGVTAAVRDAGASGDRLLAPQPWASWFEFATPGLAVAVDSRIELFPNAVWADYLTVTQAGDDWEEVLVTWDPELVVADNGDFAERLVVLGWTKVYADSEGTVLRAPGLGPSGNGSSSTALLESAR